MGLIQVNGVRSGQTFNARPWMETPFLMESPTLPIFLSPTQRPWFFGSRPASTPKLESRPPHNFLKTVNKIGHPDPGSLQVDDGIEARPGPAHER